MYSKNFNWTIEKLNDISNNIDPRPQYQRGEAWDDAKRSLLIDSILSNFDIPKIYLRYVKGNGPFDYEVADGQQRLIALWRFLADELPLKGMPWQPHLNGKVFSELSTSEQKQVREYKLVTTVVYSATNDEVRELFRRLQLGTRLNPAEIRNSIASAIGNEVRAMAETHPFFKNSAFRGTRSKYDDLAAHAFAIVIYGQTRDLKAATLRDMYEEYGERTNPSFSKKLNEILHFLDDVQDSEPRCIKTKWGFVDLVGVMAKRNLSRLSVPEVAQSYVAWEAERAENLSNLPRLAQARRGSKARNLYDYITAFQREGALKKHLEIRFQILDSILPR